MKKLVAAALLATVVLPAAADAAPFLYTFTSSSAGFQSFNFTIDDPTTGDANGKAGKGTIQFSTIINNGTDFRSGAVIFYNVNAGSGITVDGARFGTTVPLFRGVITEPAFRTGIFALTDFSTGDSVGSLSIVDGAAVVPEPASWAMMLIGFGAMGASMRYRRRRTNVVYA